MIILVIGGLKLETVDTEDPIVIKMDKYFKTCPTCKGSGIELKIGTVEFPCPNCEGVGYVHV
jgi:DnaJ-class molecular chaperone